MRMAEARDWNPPAAANESPGFRHCDVVFHSLRGEALQAGNMIEILSAGSDLESSACRLVHGCSPDIHHLPRLTMAGEFCHGPPAYGC